KPRVIAMVLVTTAVGYYLGSAGVPLVAPLLWTLAGTALAAGGTLALNQWMERDVDARMERTRHRPLPDGRLHPLEALVVGIGLLGTGLVVLAATVGQLAALVTAGITVVYLLVYTPLKRVTSLCSLAGAIPGALPPVAGWAAARGELGVEPWILFGIMFLWQIPHSLAIGRMYRDDYARAGIRVLPVVDADGRTTGTQVVSNCLALVPVALLPTLVGLAGPIYFLVALLLGLGFLWSAVALARTGTAHDARRLLFASLVYLPVLLAVMALDKLAS
ncbi:MAG TPA: heme o synthase, partial [Gaiellaceae bacterium]|nr:heme o synthase [Gaiellaceae bacterium]